ncbi:homocysteine S-methyltransferase family protein [Gymnodinialimonas sp. 2305UL16-5]|uniref:homocysteine S-methyltransferase family protein n=1 Tax=Gymnodinialimonas mytili TaxID=3126503 RepID=UPI0030A246A4
MSAVTLLDGGMGQELVARSGLPPTPLWSTDVMRQQPQLVREIHADFFAAGAQIATTNTYAIHRDRLVRARLEDQFEALHHLAIDQAIAAREAFGSGRVAGAIGPLGASYRADVHPDHIAAVALYAEVAAILAPRCDLLIAETIASVAQTRSLVEAVLPLNLPVWFAFTVDDTDGSRLRSGEPLAEAVAISDGATAVLANCSAPEAMPAALEVLGRGRAPFGAYANAFTQITNDFLADASTVDALSARRDMGPQIYADHVARWIAQGATIVGGCCEVGPAHIAAIAAQLKEAA